MNKSILEQLKIIGQLYSDGIISKEEMEVEKRKIIGASTPNPSTNREETIITGEDTDVNDRYQTSEHQHDYAGSNDTKQNNSSAQTERVEDRHKFHLPKWAYIAIPSAIVLITIAIVLIAKHTNNDDEAYSEIEIPAEPYVTDAHDLIYVDNSTTLDELFCDENIGDTIIRFDYNSLTMAGDYPNGPIAAAIINAHYVDCEMIGPQTAMYGVVKYGYKGQEYTYYCDGSTTAGCLTDPLVWVYNSQTKQLFAYMKPHFTYNEFYSLFKKYEYGLHKDNLPESFEAGGVTVRRIKKITHTISGYDEELGSEFVGTFYVYASDNVIFNGLDFTSDGYDFRMPIFYSEDEDNWMVAVLSNYGYNISFYIPHKDFASVSNLFNHDEPVTFIGSYDEDYFIREYKDGNCMVRFTQTPNVNEVKFWILGYD